MKIAVTSTDKDLNAFIDTRFGRCNYFAIYDTESEGYDFIENNAAKSEQGAGISAAQNMIDMKVDVLLTGRLGPKAKQVIEGSNIQTQFYQSGTISDVIYDYTKAL